MKFYLSHPIMALLLPMLFLTWGQAAAIHYSYEFHADARMQPEVGEQFDKAYGYMYALTDKNGHGEISVMFSNGNRRQAAQFNARVRFVDANGSVIGEQYFSRRMAAADDHGAVEGRLVRTIDLSGFDSIEVDFYLTDLAQPVDVTEFDATAPVSIAGYSFAAF